MKICIVSSADIEPGPGSTYYYRASYLSRSNGIFVIMPKGRRISGDVKCAKIYRVSCSTKTPVGHLIFAVVALLKAIRLHHHYRFDVFYPMVGYPSILVLPLMKFVTRTFWVSDFVTLPTQELEFWIWRHNSYLARLFYVFMLRIIRIVFRITLRRADLTLALSDPIKADLILNYNVDPNKILVVPDGVELENFKPLGGQRQDADFKLVYVGSISKLRCIDTLILALKYVTSEIPNARLILAGPVPEGEVKEFKKLIQRACLEGNVEWQGRIPHTDVPKLLDECDIAFSLLQPLASYEASSPSKVFEYLAMGKVVIASDILAHRNIIKDKWNGLLVKSGDPEDLAKAIKRVYMDKRLKVKLESNARDSIREYDWQNLNEKIEANIKERLEKTQKLRGK